MTAKAPLEGGCCCLCLGSIIAPLPSADVDIGLLEIAEYKFEKNNERMVWVQSSAADEDEGVKFVSNGNGNRNGGKKRGRREQGSNH